MRPGFPFNITDEYYKLLLFLDGLQPHLQLDANKQGPTKYPKAKEITRNLESALRQQARKHAATVSTLQSDQKLDDTLSGLTKRLTLQKILSPIYTVNKICFLIFVQVSTHADFRVALLKGCPFVQTVISWPCSPHMFF